MPRKKAAPAQSDPVHEEDGGLEAFELPKSVGAFISRLAPACLNSLSSPRIGGPASVALVGTAELTKDTLSTVARIARGAVSLEDPALTAHHLLRLVLS